MQSKFDLYLTCACGHARQLRAEDTPESWVCDHGTLNHAPFHKLVCLACGRRGRPQSTILSPVENRDKKMAQTEWRPLEAMPS